MREAAGTFPPVPAATTTMAPAVAGGASTTGTGRVGNLDVLRAVAAFGVLAGHAYTLGGRALPLRAERWYDVVLLLGGSGVWLFFGLSGYVIAKPFVDRLLTGRPLPELVPYALRRALRIFPLYWIALTGFIVVAGAGATRLWQYPVHLALLHNLVPGRQGSMLSVAWTLTLELLFYISLPLLVLAVRKRWSVPSPERFAGVIVLSWLASIAFTVGADIHRVDETGVWLRGWFPTMWQMFCPGILLAVAPHLRAPRWRRVVVDLPASRAALPLAAAMLAVAAILSSHPPLRFGLNVGQLVADGCRPLFAIGYGLVIAASLRARPWGQGRMRWLLHLGLVSYGIYLLHAVLLTFFIGPGSSLVPLPYGGLGPYVVHLALLSLLTVAAATASWRWLEQPCIRLAATLSGRWSARTPRGTAAEYETPA